MNVTVFGATGVVGRALLPLLAEHELTAVSRTARDEPGARTLGVTYWQAVDRFTRGRSSRSRAGWSAAGTRSRVDCSRSEPAAPSHSRSDPRAISRS